MIGRGAGAVLVGIGLAALASPGAGQAPPVAVFDEELEVRVVEIDVAVRDGDGRHVTGLGREDFRLTVDGRVAAIDFLSEQRAAPGESAVTAAAATESGVGESPVPGTTPLNLLVYVDEELSLAIDLERVLRGLESQLDRLRPFDRVAIVAWDGHRLERILGWTPPGPAVREALAAARRRPAWGLRSRLDLGGRRAPISDPTGELSDLGADSEWWLTDAAEEPCAEAVEPDDPTCRSRSGARRQIEARLRVSEVRNRLERAARAAAAAVRSIERPAGRRALVLLSGGWPLSAAVPLGSGRHPFVWTEAPALRLLDPLLDVADQLGYTIYPVDVPGMLAAFGADVERSGPGVRGPGFASLPSIPNLSEALYHDSLRYLAERTGGLAFLNGRRRVALAGISEDARDYYSIAFTAPRRRDDRAHRIEVEVRRPGVEVRARRAYRDLSEAAELDFRLEAALLDGSGRATESPLRASAGEPLRDGLFRIRLPLRLEVPRSALAGADSGRTDAPLVADLRVAAVDVDGRRTLVGPVPIELTTSASDPALVVAEVPVRFRRSDHEIAVSLFDRGTGTHLVTGLRLAR